MGIRVEREAADLIRLDVGGEIGATSMREGREAFLAAAEPLSHAPPVAALSDASLLVTRTWISSDRNGLVP